jgi:hypothetical protein
MCRVYTLVAVLLFLFCQEGIIMTSDRIPIKNLKLKCEPTLVPHTMIWGGKVSELFRETVWRGCQELCLEADPIMACIAFETGKTFSPNVKNLAGYGAVPGYVD